MAIEDINWAKSHCGLYRTPIEEVHRLMPEVWPIIQNGPMLGVQALTEGLTEVWTVDVKVHMLMPNQWPCIPNWHYDNVPRNPETGVQDFSKRTEQALMWLWLSGPPLTEFRDGYERFTVEPKTWHSFTQWDEHRGTMSEAHQWRCFIRLSPYSILKPASPNQWLRRHSQVYLDANKFKW